MTDWAHALSHAFQQHLQTTGSSGSSGSRLRKDRPRKDMQGAGAGTTSEYDVVPVVPGLRRIDVAGRGRTTATRRDLVVVPAGVAQEPAPDQELAAVRTTRTSRTTKIEEGCPPEDVFEERAAIVEYEGAIPRSWAESFALLNAASRPACYNEQQWHQLIMDGARFLDCWLERAARLKWSVLDVFGVHPTNPTTAYGTVGLVPLIRGGEITAVEVDRAVIRAPNGTEVTYLRRQQSGAIAVWELLNRPR